MEGSVFRRSMIQAEAAFIDPLTGVYGRAALGQRLQEEIERARRYQEPLSLILLDLDHFKSINDAFGHLRGDRVLFQFGQSLLGLLRSSDLVFRYGGDEFVILLPHTDKDHTVVLAQRLLDEVRGLTFEGDPPLSLSLSLGIAAFPDDANTAQVLFELADQRHIHAKRIGRGCVVSDIATPGSVSQVAEPSRLIERDWALKVVYDFLAAMPGKKRAVLEVRGAPGYGKSRFLREIQRAARLQGYIVLDIQGQPALRNRVYGSFLETLQERELSSPWEGSQVLAAGIRKLMSDKGSAGLLVSIDELADIDQATLDFWRQAFYSPGFPDLILIYTTSSSSVQPRLYLEAPLKEAITLEPVSQEGVHIWVRHSLQWEAPAQFIEWLYRETGGRPRLIQQGLTYLVEQELLKPAVGGWQFDHLGDPTRNAIERLMQIPLSEQLVQRLSSPPTHLPGGLAEFVGREEELHKIKEHISQTGLVTITGPGGIGKSRLAVQVASELVMTFPDGVYFVPLAAVDQARFIAPAIADALGFTFSAVATAGSGTGPLLMSPEAQLINYLRHKELLLVLDSFEHLLEGAALLAEIDEQVPGVRMLVTSRQNLGLPGEVVFELHGLPCPEEQLAENLERSTAVQLFLANARRINPDFTLTPDGGQDVARICSLVEGMPLGIELAAAWSGTLLPQDIAREIETTLGFLTVDRPSLAERHRSLMAVFDSFWGMLSESEQRTLSQLSVFRGGFYPEAARKVAGASPFFLDSLAAKACLRRTPHGRYEMHQLFWQYARERLGLLPEAADLARDQHCAYYTSFVQEREHLLTGDLHSLEQIRIEIENVRSAWQQAVERLDLKCLAASGRGISQYFALIGLFQEGEALLRMAISGLRSRLEMVLIGQEEQELLGWLLIFQVSLLKDMGMSRKAGPVIQEVITIARSNSDLYLEAQAMYEWGRSLLDKDLKGARQKVETALKLIREMRSRPKTSVSASIVPISDHFERTIEASCYRLQGIIAARGDNIVHARSYFERALEMQRSLGNLDDASNLLNNLGLLADMDGRRQEALDYCLQSLEIKRQLGNKAGAGRALHNLGFLASNLGDYSQALDYYEQALAIWRDTGNWSSEANTLSSLSHVTFLQGDVTKAIHYAEQAMALHRQAGNRSGLAEVLDTLGEIYMYLGDNSRALTHIQSSLNIYQEVGDRDGQASLLVKLGALWHALSDDQAATDNLLRAVQLANELGIRGPQAAGLEYLGSIYIREKRYEDAREAFQQALDLRLAEGNERLAIVSRCGLARTALEQGDLPKAMEQTNIILQFLNIYTSQGNVGHPMDGVPQPGKIYLNCYHVLSAAEDQRAADMLQQAYDLIQERANLIPDLGLRLLYLENLPIHRQILDLHKTFEPSS